MEVGKGRRQSRLDVQQSAVGENERGCAGEYNRQSLGMQTDSERKRGERSCTDAQRGARVISVGITMSGVGHPGTTDRTKWM